MAEESVALDLEINGLTSVKALKDSLKEAKNELLKFNEGTKEFASAQARVSKLKDRMDGLGDSLKIQGTGAERLKQSFGLLTESLGSGDLGKAKLAFTGIGQAMSAIPIFLLIEGLKYLYDNFDKLKELLFDTTDEVENNKKALEALQKQQEANKKALDEYIGSLEKELETMQLTNASITEQAALRQKITNVQVGNINEQIAKQEQLIESTKKEILANEALLRQAQLSAAGVSSSYEAQVKYQNEALNNTLTNQENELTSLKRLQVSKENVIAKGNDAINKLYKEASDKQKAIRDKEISDMQKLLADKASLEAEFQIASDVADANANAQEIANAQIVIEANKAENLRRKQDLEDLKALRLKADQEETVSNIEKWAKEDEQRKNALQAERDLQDAKLEIASVGIGAVQGLSEAFFAFELNQAQGNEKAQIAIRKKAFDLDKAFNIAKATGDGYKATLSAFADTPGGIVIKSVAAGVAGLFAVAQIAKIAATKFDGGNSTSSNVTTPNISSGSTNVPTITAPRQDSTLLGANGQPITQSQREQQVIQAYVLSKDVDKKQTNSRRIKEQASF